MPCWSRVWEIIYRKQDKNRSKQRRTGEIGTHHRTFPRSLSWQCVSLLVAERDAAGKKEQEFILVKFHMGFRFCQPAPSIRRIKVLLVWLICNEQTLPNSSQLRFKPYPTEQTLPGTVSSTVVRWIWMYKKCRKRTKSVRCLRRARRLCAFLE